MENKIEIVLTREQALLWLIVDHFDTTEAWGDPLKMDPFLIFIMGGYRRSLPPGCWIKIHCGYKTNGHADKSMHYEAKANDFHVEGMSPVTAERYLMKYLMNVKLVMGQKLRLIDYVGLGIYPDWVDPGFHLDTRGKRASWAFVDGQQVAYELGLKRLKEKYGEQNG